MKIVRTTPNCTFCDCGDHAFAELSAWGVALVSPSDAHWLQAYVWSLVRAGRGYFYAKSQKLSRLTNTTGLLHRAIVDTEGSALVDHERHNGLDNRRTKLREATRSQNRFNSRGAAVGQGRFKGVHKNSGRGMPWKAAIKFQGRSIHLGYFEQPRDAALAYDAAAKKYFGEYAFSNFPDHPPVHTDR